ncbi:MAG: PQQ-binding-like beta-propeller repeat protein [Pirellula sp.]
MTRSFLRQIVSGRKTFLLATAIAGSSATICYSEDWNRFRGPNGTGVASKLELSVPLSEEGILWKKEIPKGTSSPVIVDGKIYITSFEAEAGKSGGKRSVHCLDAKTGDIVWTQSLESQRVETATPPSGPATCSVACDGKSVVAFFPDAGVLVCDVEGEKKWSRDLGPFNSMHGLSASPVVQDGLIVLVVDQLADAYLTALSLETGAEVWKTERLLGVTGGYSTPALIEIDSKPYVVSPAPGELVLYDLKTGEKTATVAGLANAPVATPVVVGSRVFYSESAGQPLPMSALGNADQDGNGSIEYTEVEKSVSTLRLIQRIDTGFGDGDGKVTNAEWDKAFATFVGKGGLSCVEFTKNGEEITGKVVWNYQKSVPYIPSSLVHNGTAYLINDPGILLSFNAESGELLKRERLKNGSGSYYASPVAGKSEQGGDLMVLASLDGKLSVVQLGETATVYESYSLNETIVATPSIYNGRLFVRSEEHLYCFGKSGS